MAGPFGSIHSNAVKGAVTMTHNARGTSFVSNEVVTKKSQDVVALGSKDIITAWNRIRVS